MFAEQSRSPDNYQFMETFESGSHERMSRIALILSSFCCWSGGGVRCRKILSAAQAHQR